MEQKTEASQAVDERAEFEQWAKEACNMPPDAAINWHAVWTKAAWEGWQARAALKAQPAPTEAQGEYSARLDLTVEQIVEIADKSEFTDPDSGNEQFDRLGFARDVIEADRSIRARARTETGGVKP